MTQSSFMHLHPVQFIFLIKYEVKECPFTQDYLLKHHTHPCIDEIYLALCKDIPTLSKTTVYNTLKLFIEHGAARMLTIDERNACFDGDTSMHAHFQCKACGKIYDIPMEPESEEIESLSKNGFQIEETHHYYKGICPECREKNHEN